MSQIKLKSLLKLTEQAPQPPVGDLSGAPVPAPIAPTGINAGGQLPPTPETDTQPASPEPEDPAEYDFTRDFRAFEDKKNKAESDSKKVLMDKMNKRLLNKNIVANASRGYGQPKTDYTINAVKKISVEFWYKDYVVIVTDDKDKKYFLTPGINIKIEGDGSEAAPGDEQTPTPPGEEDQSAPGQNPAEQPAQQTPNSDAAPQNGNLAPEPTGPAAPQQQPSANPAVPQAQPEPEEDPNNPKKKVPTAESFQKDLNKFLAEFMVTGLKSSNGNVNFVPYIVESSQRLTEGKRNIKKLTCKLLIPENHMVRNLDVRDVRLAAIDTTEKNNYYGHYSKGSVDIRRNGRYYILEYVKEMGVKSAVTENTIQDPSKEEMLKYLEHLYSGLLDKSAFDDEAEIAIYWFATFNHGGQSSNLYSASSTSPFNPGPNVRGPEKDSVEEDMYDALSQKFGNGEAWDSDSN